MMLLLLSRRLALHCPLSVLCAAHSRVTVSAWSCAGPSGATERKRSHKSVHLPLSHVSRPACLHVSSRHLHVSSCRWASSETHSSDGQLIYTGSLGTAVRGVKAFSYSTSGASLLILPQVALSVGMVSHGWLVQLLFCSVVGAFSLLTPALLHLLTRGYVVRLYHRADSDTYTAVTYSLLLTEKRTVFRQEQVRLPPVAKMFTTFYADQTGLLVNPDLFTLPQDYNHLMGYDKPFSFNPEDMDDS